MSDIKKIMKYAAKLPDEFHFVNEHGEPYDDIEPLALSKSEKFKLASLCIRQKQSPETIFNRALKRSVRKGKL